MPRKRSKKDEETGKGGFLIPFSPECPKLWFAHAETVFINKDVSDEREKLKQLLLSFEGPFKQNHRESYDALFQVFRPLPLPPHAKSICHREEYRCIHRYLTTNSNWSEDGKLMGHGHHQVSKSPIEPKSFVEKNSVYRKQKRTRRK